MKASTILSVAAATLVSAAPAPERDPNATVYENINISDFYVRKTTDGPQSHNYPVIEMVSFRLSGDNATDIVCEGNKPEYPNPKSVFSCANSYYSFSLHPGVSAGYEFSLQIYHALGAAFGLQGRGNVPTACHAGGNGANDFVCSQLNALTIGINNSPPPVNP
ncbi:hypothetical protein E4U41_007542 [Claviceps citrina]|nr:hypothetical protein E4U41_007542 [Claviceps citrina]